MRTLYAVITCGPLLLMNGVGYAQDKVEQAGDDFRRAATSHEDNAKKAAMEATKTRGERVGHYLKLASIYRDMALIKHEAAAMADENRWDDINWDRYYELESQRDQLMAKVGWDYSKEHSDNVREGGNNAFIAQARMYEKEAKSAREEARQIDGPAKHMFMELSGVYEEMAGIKYKAGSAANIGNDYDLSHYQVLEERRDQLKEQIKRSMRKN